jgi:hypothetical protein
MSIHVGQRSVYLVRAGECISDVERSRLPPIPQRSSSPPPSSSSDVRSDCCSEAAAVAPTPIASATVTPAVVRQLLPSASFSEAVGRFDCGDTAPRALSAGLKLSARGRDFAQQLAAFVLRRTCGGCSPAPSHVAGKTSPPASGSCAIEGSTGDGGAALAGAAASSTPVLRWNAQGVVPKRFLHRLLPATGTFDLPFTAFPSTPKGVVPGGPKGVVPGGPTSDIVDESFLGVQWALPRQTAHYAAEMDREAGAERMLHEAGLTEEVVAVFDAPPAVFTSTLPRTIETASLLSVPTQALSALNPMETGVCQGVPLFHIRENFREEWEKFIAAPDRVRHRIAGAESILDVVARLAPVVVEIERCRRPVVIVSHLSTLQVQRFMCVCACVSVCVSGEEGEGLRLREG